MRKSRKIGEKSKITKICIIIPRCKINNHQDIILLCWVTLSMKNPTLQRSSQSWMHICNQIYLICCMYPLRSFLQNFTSNKNVLIEKKGNWNHHPLYVPVHFLIFITSYYHVKNRKKYNKQALRYTNTRQTEG